MSFALKVTENLKKVHKELNAEIKLHNPRIRRLSHE